MTCTSLLRLVEIKICSILKNFTEDRIKLMPSCSLGLMVLMNFWGVLVFEQRATLSSLGSTRIT